MKLAALAVAVICQCRRHTCHKTSSGAKLIVFAQLISPRIVEFVEKVENGNREKFPIFSLISPFKSASTASFRQFRPDLRENYDKSDENDWAKNSPIAKFVRSEFHIRCAHKHLLLLLPLSQLRIQVDKASRCPYERMVGSGQHYHYATDLMKNAKHLFEFSVRVLKPTAGAKSDEFAENHIA